jgi:caffeoyl-CoA O-methyltransferase
MEFVDPAVEAYAEAHTTQPEPVLRQLAEETRATLQAPAMLTGTVEGRFLELLVHGLRARRVLEIGTYSGYGTLSMAAALPPDGRIDTLEIDERHAEVARRYLAEAGHADRVTVHLGPALETLNSLEGTFDFVFIDADKVNYLNYYEAVLPRLAEDGLIAADNTLWSGRVARDQEGDENTEALREFNDHVADDGRVVAVVLTVRDGITLIRRR